MSEEKPKVYTDEEIRARIQAEGLESWYLEDGWLRRKVTTDGWQTTLQVVNAVGFLCEAAWHHADLSVSWAEAHDQAPRPTRRGGSRIRISPWRGRLRSSSTGDRSKASPLEGTPNKFVKTK